MSNNERKALSHATVTVAPPDRCPKCQIKSNSVESMYCADKECPIKSVAVTVAGVEWRCFHCDEVFTDAEKAAEHFGPSLRSEPACHIDAAKYREMEEAVERSNAEDTDLHRTIYRMQSEHSIALRREEEKGYAKGLEDARKEANPNPVQPAAEAVTVLTVTDMGNGSFGFHRTLLGRKLPPGEYQLYLGTAATRGGEEVK